MYLGANLELPGLPIALAVHGEQCMIAQAWAHRDSITALAVNASPCGHCRQFLNEQDNASSLHIMFPDTDTTLAHLLPNSFGPKDLGVTDHMCQDTTARFPPLQIDAWQASVLTAHPDAPADLTLAACRALAMCYTPYSQSHSAVALRSPLGVFAGGLLECAAYNPTLPPLLTAHAQHAMRGGKLADVTEVLVLEVASAKFSFVDLETMAVKHAAPNASLWIHRLPTL